MRQRESYYKFVLYVCILTALTLLVKSVTQTTVLTTGRTNTSQTYWSSQYTCYMRAGCGTKITNYRSGFYFYFFMKSPLGALCGFLCLWGDSSPRGPTINERAACLCCNGPFRIQPSQMPGQSRACLFVCACSLFFLLLYPFLFLSIALCRDFFSLIPQPVCCMSDRSVCVSPLNGPIVWRLR